MLNMKTVYVATYYVTYTFDPYYGPRSDVRILGVYATKELAFQAIEQELEKRFGKLSDLDPELYDLNRTDEEISITNMATTYFDGDSGVISSYCLIEES